MHRFFIPPELFKAQTVILSGDQAFQIRRVLRLRPGEHVVLLDGCGGACEGTVVSFDEGAVRLETGPRWQEIGEPAVHLTLYQAVLKGERFGWALQKCTEVGVARFVPVACARNVVDDLDAGGQKHERWERIIREAAEQSRRAILPELAPIQLFPLAVKPPAGAPPAIRLIPWEEERVAGLGAVLAGCNLGRGARIEIFVGPEGGFAPDEIALARGYGAIPVSLGKRILRAETAGLVAATAILYHAGEI